MLDTYALTMALPAWWLYLIFVYTDNKHVIKYPIGLSCFWFFRRVSVDQTYWLCTAFYLLFTTSCTACGALQGVDGKVSLHFFGSSSDTMWVSKEGDYLGSGEKQQ